jgi:hypothetical protein
MVRMLAILKIRGETHCAYIHIPVPCPITPKFVRLTYRTLQEAYNFELLASIPGDIFGIHLCSLLLQPTQIPNIPIPNIFLTINKGDQFISHHFIQERESWTESVSKSLETIKAACSAIEYKLEQDQ